MKNFLRRFFRRSAESGLSATVAADEPLARFLFHKGSHFAPGDGRVKPRAFEPARADNQTSVFRTLDLADEMIWRLGDDHVAPLRKKPVLARAELRAGNVAAVNLRIAPDDSPPRHASISGWPSAKHERMLIAEKLAADARLVVRPGVPDRPAA